MTLPTKTPGSWIRPGGSPRGAFVLLEGVDRCGKTTQCKLLVQRLVAAGIAATALRFPDRTSATGQIINQYLQQQPTPTPQPTLATTTTPPSSSSSPPPRALNDQAIHLLFSANRWESSQTILDHLYAGTTVVCDRYAYSGVAFSAAKETTSLVTPSPSSSIPNHHHHHHHHDDDDDIRGEDETETTKTWTRPTLSTKWCQDPDRGLPAPDCVLFLDIKPEMAEQRGGYGNERYEDPILQRRVRERFRELQRADEGVVPWHIIDATPSIDIVEEMIWKIAFQTIHQVKGATDKPVACLWQEGYWSDSTTMITPTK